MDVSSIKPQVNSTVVRDGGVSSAAESRQKQGFSNLTAASPADDQSVARAATPAQEVSREQVEDEIGRAHV